MAKGYNLTPDYVLYNMSYANTILYGSVLLSSDEVKEPAKKVINADDPANKDEIRKELFG